MGGPDSFGFVVFFCRLVALLFTALSEKVLGFRSGVLVVNKW
jgi:hypothetical protein